VFAHRGVAPASIREFPENRENNREFRKFPARSAIADVDLRSNSMVLDANSRCIRNREIFRRNRESFRQNREFTGLAVRARFARRRAGEASVAPANAAKTLDGFVSPNLRAKGRDIAALILLEKFGFVSPTPPGRAGEIAPGVAARGMNSPRPLGCGRRAAEIRCVIDVIFMWRTVGRPCTGVPMGGHRHNGHCRTNHII
jgi:hypothetical protein